jgi:hypothetical protein
MTELIEIIVSQVSIWLPSLVSVIGVVVAILSALSKAKAGIEEFKQDKTVKNLSADLQKALSENKEIKQELDIVIDELKKIENYRKELNKQ